MTAATRVSFTVTRYTPAGAVLGAAHMATQRLALARTPGLRFARLLGMGSGIGFSARPDLLRWALLCAWSSEEAWEEFQTHGSVMRQYRERGVETYSLLLEPSGGHGEWDGQAPWSLQRGDPDPGERVVALTRATIRLSRALRFWSQVSPVEGTLRGLPGLLLSFGVGEVPYLRQATLSVWQSADAMQRWAYGEGRHREVIRRTRDERWYAEELFSRFRLLRTLGTLGGTDPLAPA